MSSSTLREARSKKRAFDSEIQYYKQEVTRMSFGSTLRVDFDKLRSYQQELRTLENQCDSWRNKIVNLKSRLSKKDDSSAYNEAVSLISAFDSQSALMNQIKDFFVFTSNTAEETEHLALRHAQSVAAAVPVRAAAVGVGLAAGRGTGQKSGSGDIGNTVRNVVSRGVRTLADLAGQGMALLKTLPTLAMLREMEEYGYSAPIGPFESEEKRYLAVLEAYLEMLEIESIKLYNRLITTDSSGAGSISWDMVEELLWKQPLTSVETTALAKMFLEMGDADGRTAEENLEIFFMCAYQIERDPDDPMALPYFVPSPNLEVLNNYCQNTLIPSFNGALYTALIQNPDNLYDIEMALKDKLNKLALLNDVTTQAPSRFTVNSWNPSELATLHEGMSYYEITKKYIEENGGDMTRMTAAPILDITWPSGREGVAYEIRMVNTLNYYLNGGFDAPFTSPSDMILVTGMDVAGISHALGAGGALSASAAMNNLVLESLKPQRGSGAGETGKFAAGQAMDWAVDKIFDIGFGALNPVAGVAKAGLEEFYEYMQDMETLGQIEGTMTVNDYLKRVGRIGGSCQISLINDKPYIQYSYYPAGTFDVIADAYYADGGGRLSASEVEQIIFVDSLKDGFGEKASDDYSQAKTDFYEWLDSGTGDKRIAEQWDIVNNNAEDK